MSTSARRAAIEAAVPATKNRAFKSAWWSGVYAFRTGKAITECPYSDLRGGRNGYIITWSRAFRRFWTQGYRDAEKIG